LSEPPATCVTVYLPALIGQPGTGVVVGVAVAAVVPAGVPVAVAVGAACTCAHCAAAARSALGQLGIVLLLFAAELRTIRRRSASAERDAGRSVERRGEGTLSLQTALMTVG
jgi:hypothetical protein